MATTESENRQRNSTSPSPPPVPPTASTPGIRASAFQKLHNDALASTLKAISYDSFADCFPLIAAQAPGSLRAMHGDFISRLERFAKVCFVPFPLRVFIFGVVCSGVVYSGDFGEGYLLWIGN